MFFVLAANVGLEGDKPLPPPMRLVGKEEMLVMLRLGLALPVNSAELDTLSLAYMKEKKK